MLDEPKIVLAATKPISNFTLKQDLFGAGRRLHLMADFFHVTEYTQQIASQNFSNIFRAIPAVQ
jgi:hypothetical protein